MNGLDDALAAVERGELIVIPTDTAYGLAARADLPGAVTSVFEVKGRPGDKPLPVLGAELASLQEVAAFDDRARILAQSYWPGPLTLILPRAAGFDHDLGGRYEPTVAVRIPAHEVALDLLRRTGPLAVTSANRSGQQDASTVEEARAALGDEVAVYVDGGVAAGVPSTVFTLVGEPRVVRTGPLSETELLARL